MEYLVAINDENQQVYICLDKIVSFKKLICNDEKVIEINTVNELFLVKKIEGVTHAMLFIALEDWLND